jgi:hypothetical protein
MTRATDDLVRREVGAALAAVAAQQRQLARLLDNLAGLLTAASLPVAVKPTRRKRKPAA